MLLLDFMFFLDQVQFSCFLTSRFDNSSKTLKEIGTSVTKFEPVVGTLEQCKCFLVSFKYHNLNKYISVLLIIRVDADIYSLNLRFAIFSG